MTSQMGAGAVVAGKYRIDRVLGEGGMGVVVAATHLQLDQPVALKFMLPQAMANAEAVTRFTREARASVKLKSAHVARTLDVGTLENGAPYIVMELLSGSDLASLLKAQGRVPVATASDYLLQALHAIAEAHALGIVHRDLKPHNLFLTTNPDGTACIKVLDFGIAKVAKEVNEPTLTNTNACMGSPGYMSPEQLRSTHNVDSRTDVWALGAILYELVTGRAAFEGETLADLYIKVATEPLLPLGVPGMPPGFEEVVRRCLEKDPDARYQSVAEVAWALAPFAGPLGSIAAERVARCLGAAASAALTPSAMAKAARPTELNEDTNDPTRDQRRAGAGRSARTWIVAVIGAAALVVVIAVVAGAALRGNDSAPSSAGSAPAAEKPAPRVGATLPEPPVAHREASPLPTLDAGPARQLPVAVEVTPTTTDQPSASHENRSSTRPAAKKRAASKGDRKPPSESEPESPPKAGADKPPAQPGETKRDPYRDF